MVLTIDRIVQLFESNGHDRYGTEAVSQTEHALQCATQAEISGATPELISASLLHDLGHLLHSDEDHLEHGVDDVHQFLAIRPLRGLFSDAVLVPIRLHVDAKRYLCAVEPGYWQSLSPASKRSLELQGIYSSSEAQQFIAQPFARDALMLRRWDDLAKVEGLRTPPLAHFLRYLCACTKASP